MSATVGESDATVGSDVGGSSCERISSTVGNPDGIGDGSALL